MSLRFHEIAEAHHRIQNPLTEAKLDMIGSLCGLKNGTRVLDLACGKGELLSRFARDYGIIGIGVDISAEFIHAARVRADELEVLDQLHFVVDDAAQYPQPFHEFDMVSCIGATWIGGGLIGTLELMLTALKPRDGFLLVGEPYWHDTPPPDVAAALNVRVDDFATLGGTLARIESVGLDLVEMVLADTDSWDRYEAMQWYAVDQWLRENPEDPDAPALQRWISDNRRAYLNYGRRYMGWGVFVMRPPAQKV